MDRRTDNVMPKTHAVAVVRQNSHKTQF